MYTDVPVATIQLFAALDELLIELLESLSPEDWHKQTLAPDWKVTATSDPYPPPGMDTNLMSPVQSIVIKN